MFSFLLVHFLEMFFILVYDTYSTVPPFELSLVSPVCSAPPSPSELLLDSLPILPVLCVHTL